MKRFGVVLLSLGLIVAFSATVFAVDLKFSGEYYAAGMYLDRTTVKKDTATDGPSTAFYYQRLRVKTDFAVSPGLTLITRLDAMERAWGATRTAPGTTLAVDSAGTVAENENIVFDWAYVNYKSPIGVFNVGYMNYGSTGTIFGDNSTPQARIKYSYPIGPVMINATISKVKENSPSVATPAGVTDADNDVYHLEGVYTWKAGRAGFNVNYYRSAEKRPATAPAPNNFKTTYFLYTPYVMAQIGPVYVQAEINYANGKTREYDSASGQEDVKLENWSGWVDATADFKMAYVGATVAYVSGDNPDTAKQEGGTISGGRDWNPCLILFNYYDRAQWIGNLTGFDGSSDNGQMSNAWFFQGRAGVRPVDKLDVMASVSYAVADRKPGSGAAAYKDGEYGIEADLTATYKITNNLSYMLGVGYLFTGDYYKGANATGTNNIGDDFLVTNKLTLTF
jgi:hypothetical protein